MDLPCRCLAVLLCLKNDPLYPQQVWMAGMSIAAQVDVIVSGDDDLLDLKAFNQIPIITPAEALRRLASP